ncbi:phage major capsid protein [Vagococcus salmoninarum]|uniref:Phage major capsid protein n=1 Tax=Vagococcus salmoninarum TaxID=2739 RepID=A0A429ZVE1_9ENTE|nr:phage major capsid protein [Vagococcus salmoninarum]RST97747.1 phage major capsid protein [Vagococcus salmoninarum]RST98008.1 phage major capsid protein [Vagococcus salmoninarum]
MSKEVEEKRLTDEAELKSKEAAVPDETAAESDPEKKGKMINGYALKFDTPSKDLGGFQEVITKDALKDTDLSDVVLLVGHDYSKPLARVKNGTLKLEVDETGLKFEATLPNTSYANDVYENIKAGNTDSMSFGFKVGEDGDEFEKRDGEVIRKVNSIQSLWECSIVTVPAYDDTNVKVDTRSYDQFLTKNTDKKKEEIIMKKTLIDTEKTELRSFEDYIRSHGEVRDGLTTINTDVVIPKDVTGEVFDLKRATTNLAQFVTVKQVSNGEGKYPVATNQQAILATKAELAEIADIDADMFTQVDYKVETRAGKIALSNEVVEDAVVDIVAEVKAQLTQLVDNTDNKHIIDLLKTFKKVPAASLDDLKKVYNVELDPALNKMIMTNQTGFNHLDTLKDSDGRYILQPDVTSPSGYSLFGSPMLVVSDKQLANNGKAFPMIMGDLKQAVFVARRNQVTTQWEKFDYYSQGLAVIVRNDYKKIDGEAARYIEFTPAVGE